MRRIFAICLFLSLLLTFPACSLTIPMEEYTSPKETIPPETYDSGDVPGQEPGESIHLETETIEDLVNGTTTHTEYHFSESGTPQGLTIWENEAEVRTETWETDARGNLTKNTITYPSGETEIWEYQLTYNAYFDILKKVCTRNGIWQYTYDYEYIPKPYRLRFINVEQSGTDCPPWYAFAYKNNRLVSIREIYPDTAQNYRVSGSVRQSQEDKYDNDGKLTLRMMCLDLGDGQELRYYEKITYEGNAANISRFESGSNDLLLTAKETYDENGNLILREEFSPEGTLTRRTSCDYLSITIS